LDADGDLYWATEANGKTERYDDDPSSTAWQRAKVRFIRILLSGTNCDPPRGMRAASFSENSIGSKRK
jgi:hypothetical protein